MKIVLDSNVLISAFATRGVCADLFREVLATHHLMVSDYILAEVRENLSAKFKIPDTTVAGIIDLLHPFLLHDQKLPLLDLTLRDPDDVPILAFAVAVNADLLITGDRDLLDIATVSPVRIVSPRDFFSLE